MSHLLRLLYVSRATPALEPSAISKLLENAQLNNGLVDISGVLCSGRGYFVQVMEGLEDRVLPLYAKVQKDERHRQASLLSIELVSERAFPGWSMAHIDGDVLGADLHARLISQTLVARDTSASAKLLLSILKSLRRAS